MNILFKFPILIFFALSTIPFTNASNFFSTSKSIFYDVPKNHFDGIGTKGNVEIVEQIGELTLEKGKKIPFSIVFNSLEKSVSPHLGKGWRLPLFESTAIQENEHRYRVNMPDGRILHFRQSNINKDKFIASSIWSAMRKNEVFTVKSIDGIELTYKNGRLQKIESANERLSFSYQGGRLLQLSNNSSVLLECTVKNGEILFNEKSSNTNFIFSFVKVIEKIPAHQKKIKEKAETQLIENCFNYLSTVKIRNKIIKEYTYRMDDSSIFYLTINDFLKKTEQKISWNALNGLIKTKDDYQYVVKSPGKSQYAAIERTGGPFNQKEYWYKDTWNGKETTLRADGVTLEQSWFTSGKLKGLPRSLSIKKDKFDRFEEYSYDENGRLIRLLANGKETFFIYNTVGTLAALVVDGKLVREYVKNAQDLAKEYLK